MNEFLFAAPTPATYQERSFPGDVFWLEHVMEKGKDIGVASRRAVDQLSDSGVPVDVQTFADPPIWLIHERDFAPQLLAATDILLS